MDCFVEPVIGRRFAPTRWLVMTVLPWLFEIRIISKSPGADAQCARAPRTVGSLPPCGGELERGVAASTSVAATPSLTLPRKGGGNAAVLTEQFIAYERTLQLGRYRPRALRAPRGRHALSP